VVGRYQVAEASECDLLVEVEPVAYQLTVEEYTKGASESRERTVLAATSIFRFTEGQQEEARMQKMVSYSYSSSTYLGHIPGTLRGLPATMHLPTGERREVQWGVPTKVEQREAVMVGRTMARNTAVDVAVVADALTEERPFLGTLVAVFPDGGRRERRVEAVIQTRSLNNIKPEYSEVKAIHQQVVVEVTTSGVVEAREVDEDMREMGLEEELRAEQRAHQERLQQGLEEEVVGRHLSLGPAPSSGTCTSPLLPLLLLPLTTYRGG